MIENLIDKLIHYNIRLELLPESKLKVHGDIHTLPGDVLQEMRDQKEDLVKYLNRDSGEDYRDGIPLAPVAESYALSSTQRRLWILGQFKDSNAAYNVPRAYVFEGRLDLAALNASFDALLDRHESLRTVFREDGQGAVKQFVLSLQETGFRINMHDLRHSPTQARQLEAVIHDAFIRPFVLAKGPLLRADLIQVSDQRWIFTYVMHHIISDGWSMGILFRELLLLYHAFLSGSPDPLPPLRIQYKDYAAWQQQQLSGAVLEAHKSYWLQQFSGEIPVLELPGDKVRPAIKTYAGDVVSRTFSSGVAAGIKALLQENDCTLFMGMLAAVNALLYRYTGQDDMVIGTPVAGREHIDLEHQIGFYANTLALRTRFSGENSFRELLANVRQITLGAYEHQVFPFDELVDMLNTFHDRSRNPLFDIQVTVQNLVASGNPVPSASGALQISTYLGVANNTSVFDMVFNFVESAEGLQLRINYNTDVCAASLVHQQAAHLEQLLAAIIAHPDQPLKDLDFLSEAEKHLVLHTFNDVPVNYPAGKTLTALWEEQVGRTPGLPAVVSDGITLSYRDLDEQADRLANHLLHVWKVRPGEMIGVMLDRSGNLIIAMVAIWKAGGAYVPVNASYPRARKAFIADDAGFRVLITQTDFLADLDYFSGNIFAIDIELDGLATTTSVPSSIAPPGTLAYVIYTSGSTGEPKGVMMGHAAAAGAVLAQKEVFDVQEGDRHLQFCSISFDVSVLEILLALLSGATLYIASDAVKDSPAATAAFIRNNNITLACIPPAYLLLLPLDEISTLRKLITGGETAMPEIVAAFSRTGSYYNAYGPTESSLSTSVYAVSGSRKVEDGPVPIGKPIPGVQVYVLDEQMALVPPGVTGEMYIGGSGLADGYLNNPDLTSEKFVPNPFFPAQKIYKTGDIGKWLPDGNLVFIGRKDSQVKLNGYRIELGEIENALQHYPGIASAVVLLKKNGKGERHLVAYFTADEPLHIPQVRAGLSKILPAYMLPAYFIMLDAFPLTSNGKVDRNALPEPDKAEMPAEVSYMAPRNALEETLVKIWEEILGREQIGVKDDYFELGGSSLKAMIVVKKLMDETGLSLPLKILFEEKTVENIVCYLEQMEQGKPPAIYDYQEAGLLSEASFNQKSYFSAWSRKADHLVVAAYQFPQLQVKALSAAIQQLIDRHEVLRTRIVLTEGKIMQEVLPPGTVSSGITGVTPLSGEDALHDIIAAEHFYEFNLGTAPHFRVQVFKPEDGAYTVLLTLHHILTDGYSGGILKQELLQLYNAAVQGITATLPALPFQYRHFAAWQRSFLGAPEGGQHRRYWLNKLNDFRHQLNFPEATAKSDREHQDVIAFFTTVTGTKYEQLTAFTKTHGLTNTSLMMGVLVLMLHRLTSENDITIGTTVSGRNSRHYGELEISGLIGFFANLLLVRNTIDGSQQVLSFLQQVQHGFLDDLEHDTYPFGQLLQELPGIMPETFFNGAVSYNYHNYQHRREADLDTTTPDTEEQKPGEITLDVALVLAVTEYRNGLQVQFIFNADRFSYEQRKAYRNLYFSLLRQVMEHASLPVETLINSESICYKTGKTCCMQCLEANKTISVNNQSHT